MIIQNLEKEPIEITITRWVFAEHVPDQTPLMKFLVSPHNQLHVSIDGPDDSISFEKGQAMVVEGTGSWKLVSQPIRFLK